MTCTNRSQFDSHTWVIISVLFSDVPGASANFNIGYFYRDFSLHSSVTPGDNLGRLFSIFLSVPPNQIHILIFLCLILRHVQHLRMLAGVAYAVQGLATGWKVRGSNPGRGGIFRNRPDWPWVPNSLLYNVYRVFTVGKLAGGAALTTHPLLAPRLKQESSYTYNPSLGLRGLF